MRLNFILLYFYIFVFNSAHSKVFDFKVKGIVLDSLSESPIENATIQLFFESNLMKTSVSKYDGSFNLGLVNSGHYSLTVSHIGYKTQTIPFTISDKIISEIKVKLQLDEVDLKEVTVKANKPLVSQQNGEIAYQIEGGIWQNSGNALNVINRIPILKGRSGSAYLLYGTKVVFLLDGKPIESIGVSLEAILSNLGSVEIDKIEILQSPPPYLARFGKPLVNIKTLKQKENGSLLSLSHGFGRGINNRFNNGIKYSLKQNNLLLGLSFTQSQINQLSKINSLKEAPNLKFEDITNANSKNDLYNIKLAGEYGKAKFGSINFSYDYKNYVTPSNTKTIGNYLVTNKIDNIILNANTNTKSNQNLAGLDYNKKFSNIFNIKSSIEIGQYGINTDENIGLERLEKQSKFVNPWDRSISFQNYYLENESKFGNILLTEGIFYKTSESKTNFIKNVGNSSNSINSFNYLENISSAFISSNYAKGKSTVTAGLNLEHTDIEGYSNLKSDLKKVNFFSLLPNFALNYQINDAKSLNLSYSRGINRPDYEWLNQQELYKNPYNKNIGGGILQPTIYNKITLTSTFQNGLSLTGIYANQRNRYSFFPFLTTENIVNFSAINIQKFYYLYYSAAFQKYLSSVWYFSSDISGYYSNMKSPDYGIKNSGYTQQFSVSNYFIFKKIGQFGLTSSFNTTDYADSYQFLPQFSLNIDYSKSIFRKNGSINVSFSDITNSLKDRFVYKLGNFSVKDSYKFETRLLKISINYKLGNKSVKLAAPRNSKSESEIERLK